MTNDALQPLISRAEQGDNEAIKKLGSYYWSGVVTDHSDIDEAIKWYRKGAEYGYADCMYLSALLLHLAAHIERKTFSVETVEKQLSYLNEALLYLDKLDKYPEYAEKAKSLRYEVMGSKGIAQYFWAQTAPDEFTEAARYRIGVYQYLKPAYQYVADKNVALYLGLGIRELLWPSLSNVAASVSEEDKRLHVQVLIDCLNNYSSAIERPDLACVVLGLAFQYGDGCQINYNTAVYYYQLATQYGADSSGFLNDFTETPYGWMPK